MKLMKIFFTFMLVFTLAACNQDQNDQGGADIDNSKAILEGTLVDGSLLNSKELGLIYININENTTFKTGVSEELSIGNYIKVEYDGTILESYPSKASDEAIKIIENKEQEFPLGLKGYFNKDDIITVNRLDGVFLYQREFDFCAQALEKVYEDSEGAYYLPCISASNYAVFSDGEFMSLIDAFESEVIHPNDVKEYINIQNESEAVSK